MTFGKASALACGFVGATAFGIWLSPHSVTAASGRLPRVGERRSNHPRQGSKNNTRPPQSRQEMPRHLDA